ncbi:hypothetical protein GPJ56_005261 [Histomonas meleagridis]|uniref:uncharacterized protein n=1 Tax=Histomonas meleagridis TaxID=135588 RepID=UPI00355A472F|nr:hypothetical protein GPJ56_005261 [Histomonas meleagridis]KAH0802111.1 hypothetical protein GO595_005192 [Histomonas meleagridis]
MEDEVQQLLQEIRNEHGTIMAHPMMYVSALHNPDGSYPVDQTDEFFVQNGIKFLDPPQINPDPPESSFIYSVTIDTAGSFNHSIIPK